MKRKPSPSDASSFQHGVLGQLPATAICGNDITSSCLYVSALSIMYAGKWAPLALVMVAAVLYLFRSIYGEVVGALPLNGGAYNALLNTTSKFRASVAACLTILSYMATAVISAVHAMHYGHMLWTGLPVFEATVGLLALFMILTILGITESAVVAVVIFLTHLATLTLLLIVGAVHLQRSESDVFKENMYRQQTGTISDIDEQGGAIKLPARDESDDHVDAAPELVHFQIDALQHAGEENGDAIDLAMFPRGSEVVFIAGDSSAGQMQAVSVWLPKGSLLTALFFGFCAAMLGISGFESSSNFVEEQAEGVFPKTLRNMWIAVSVCNPAMALLALSLFRIGDVNGKKEALLAHMGEVAGGNWLSSIVSIDATLVLSGAVLTSYVGVNGLVRRMTLDRCLPQFLLKTNKRGTTHRVIVGFFLLAVSVLWITDGETTKLAGVYTISFLAVMALFGLGNVLLKIERSRLPRPVVASWPAVLIAMGTVIAGLVGNVVMNPDYFRVFLQYFVPAMLIISVMLGRIAILTVCLFVVRGVSVHIRAIMDRISRGIAGKIDDINSQQMVFFTRGEGIANLNRAMLYVSRNEHTNRIKFVTVVTDPKEVPKKLTQEIKFLDEAYPEIDIEFVTIEGRFGPEIIQELSEEWNIPTNLMFIGSHGGRFRYDQAMLGGVRLII